MTQARWVYHETQGSSYNRGLPPVDGTSDWGKSLGVKSLRALVRCQPRRSPYQFKFTGVMVWQAQVSAGLGSKGWGLNLEMIGLGMIRAAVDSRFRCIICMRCLATDVEVVFFYPICRPGLTTQISKRRSVEVSQTEVVRERWWCRGYWGWKSGSIDSSKVGKSGGQGTMRACENRTVVV